MSTLIWYFSPSQTQVWMDETWVQPMASEPPVPQDKALALIPRNEM